MSLYAIGDLHLHYQSVLKAPGQLHGRVWKNHEEKFRKNCAKTLTPADTLVLVGDHSWGKNLAECEQDLEYIRELPGRKILTRGNHDMFWDVKKTGRLNELYRPDLTFVQDSYDSYQNYAIVAKGLFTSIAEEGSSAGTKKPKSTPRNWSRENLFGSEDLLTWLRQMDIENSSCSCTIHPPTSLRREADLRTWRRSTVQSR